MRSGRKRIAVSRTCARIGRPASGWSTFATPERMRVPAPAANTITSNAMRRYPVRPQPL